MTATLVGSFSVGEAVPGIFDTLNIVGDGLTALKSSVDAVLGNLTALASAINALAADIDDTVSDITIGPFDALNAQLTSAKSGLQALEGITDASQYVDDIVASLDATKAELLSIVPADYLSDQIAAVTSAVGALQSSVDDFQNQLDSLTSISDDVRAQTAELTALQRLLQSAADEALAPIVEFNEALSALGNIGVFVVHYDGALGSLGSQVDSVLPGTGIGTTEDVTGPLLVVRNANTATLAALKDAFGIG